MYARLINRGTLVWISLVLVWPSALHAVDFDALLAAGEFPVALEQARLATDPGVRDRRLARIAAAQLQAGATDAALATSADIYDQQLRADTLKIIRSQPIGGRVAGERGGAQADFDAIIELIQSTIAPNTWDEVGGPGAIQEFAGGVYVDPSGVLQRIERKASSSGLGLLRADSVASRPTGDVRRRSALRKVSLPRLEKQVQLRLAAGHGPTEAMQVLAGLERVKYVFLYPESGDIVLAGPASDWRRDAENRLVSTDSGQPVVRLDDLVVVFRHMLSQRGARFGCSINPTDAGLARTKAFLAESSKRSLRRGERDDWLERVRATLGKQDIVVRGLDPRTRAARIMVEADYRMKLVGMGLEEGVLGVDSYLDSIQVPPGQAPPPLDVLRWWFTLNYQALTTTDDRNAFELHGPGVKVLSENELLTEQGQRVHTGKSDALNQQFAGSFTQHFDALCAKYPIYAELRNLFDLGLVAALLQVEDIPAKTGWKLTGFLDPNYPVELGTAPTQVDTVINHRVINRVHIVAGVSGGVHCAPASLVHRDAIQPDTYGQLPAEHSGSAPEKLPSDAWWWD